MVKIKEMIKVGGQFSGVGAFDQALKRLGIEYENIYQAEWDKYARQTYLHNYEEPVYYVKDVHDTPTEEITEKYGSLDIAMFSPPCQAFSLAGKRLGKEDQRGILFFNSHEFIKVNKPRYFIFENVKGLLSDDNGKTFQEWVNLLGGKSVNGDSVLFPYPDSVPYHLYWKVLNAKDHGVPQNRERVFLIGIRDDKDNNFRWPVEERLVKRLKDVLEDQVDEKYFLSEQLLSYFADHRELHKNRGNGFEFKPHDKNTKVSNAISTKCGTRQTDPYIKIKSATSKGYEEAKEDAQTLDTACNQGVMVGAFRGRNPNNPSDRTTGAPTQQQLEINKSGTSNTITIVQKDNVVIIGDYRADEGFRWQEDGNSPCLTSSMKDYPNGWNEKAGTRNPPIIATNQGVMVYNIPENISVRKYPVDINKLQKCLKKHKTQSNLKIAKSLNIPKTLVDHWFRTDQYFAIPTPELWLKLKEILAIDTNEFDISIMEFEEREGVFEKSNRVYDSDGLAPTITSTNSDEKILNNYKIRRLTPRECFRLMDFPDSFTWPVSDSQAYKQAGNSIVVNVLYKIIANFNL